MVFSNKPSRISETDLEKLLVGQGLCPSKKMISLDEALDYSNDQIIHRFTTIYDIPYKESAELFTETKKFLWLCSQSDVPTAPIRIIDKMWHNFILFTPDYIKFCLRKFGYFIHHIPADKRNSTQQQNQNHDSERKAELATQMKLVNQTLGKHTLVKWYVEYAQRYNTEFYEKHTVIPKGITVDFSGLKSE